MSVDQGLGRPRADCPRMIEVRPLEDELAEAHAARHQRIETLSSPAAQTRMLRERFGIAGGIANKYPKTNLLAAVGGMTPEDYVRRHTMLPFSTAVPHVHGQTTASVRNWLGVSCHLGLNRPIKEVRICVECVAIEQSAMRLGTYRRRHHLPGTSRCPYHGIRLHVVNSEQPFSALPNEWIGEGRVTLAPDIEGSVNDQDWLNRYRSICLAMMRSDHPMPCVEVNQALIAALQAEGLSTYLRRSQPLVSDLIRVKAGPKWVAENLPAIASREPGEIVPLIDGFTENRKTPRTTVVYAAMWACLDVDPWTQGKSIAARSKSLHEKSSAAVTT